MSKITKKELVEKISNVTGEPKTKTQNFLTAFVEVVTEEFLKGNDIALPGLGTFKVKHREARRGRNPQTGKAIQIPAKTVVTFKPSPNLTIEE